MTFRSQVVGLSFDGGRAIVVINYRPRALDCGEADDGGMRMVEASSTTGRLVHYSLALVF